MLLDDGNHACDVDEGLIDKLLTKNWVRLKQALEASGKTDSFFYKRAAYIVQIDVTWARHMTTKRREHPGCDKPLLRIRLGSAQDGIALALPQLWLSPSIIVQLIATLAFKRPACRSWIGR